MKRISVLFLVALAIPAVASGAARDVKLSLVAYSTPREAYGKLMPAFQQTAAGKTSLCRRLEKAGYIGGKRRSSTKMGWQHASPQVFCLPSDMS